MSDTIETIKNYPDVSFIDDYTLDQMMGDMIEDFQDKYKEVTGQTMTLEQADPNRLILYAAALQIYQGFQNIDKGAKMSFLKYSYGDYLENLAALKGLERSEGSYAVTTLRFTLSETRTSAVSIPMGTRAANSAQVYFYTTEAAEIPAGDLTVDVPAQAVEVGTDANDLEIGEVNVLVDPIGYVASVSNTTKTQGGTGEETDDELKERIYLAPSAYSTAGSKDAYVYLVKNYSSSIADVYVYSPSSGVVNIRVLLDGGELPTTSFLEAVSDYLEEDNSRPLTDNIVVEAPDTVSYDVTLTYYIGKSNSGSEETIKSEVEQAVTEYNIWQQGEIGRDINPDALIQKILTAGAKRTVVTSPTYTAISEIAVAQIGTVTLTYGGLEND